MATSKRVPCRVTTWQAPSGATLDICFRCEALFITRRAWPRDPLGQEYARLARAAHRGFCQTCQGGTNGPDR